LAVTIKQVSKYVSGGLIALLVIGGLVAAYGINQIRFGGEMQRANAQMADFEASINPPSAYLLEPFMEVNLMANNPENFAEHAEYLARQKAEWERSTENWADADLDPDLKAGLAQTTRTHGGEFWREVEGSLLPAIKADRMGAANASLDRLLQIYRAHRGAVDELLAQTATKRAALAEQTTGTVFLTTTVLIALGLALGGALGASVWIVRRTDDGTTCRWRS
jgi:methyl-accepting chemotaxis protein